MISINAVESLAKSICPQYGVDYKHIVSIFIRESFSHYEKGIMYLNESAIGDSGKSWGLGQVYKDTREILNSKHSDNIEYWFNPENAIKESSRLIRDIQNHIRSKGKSVTLERICAGYNAGQSRFDSPPESTRKHYIPYVLKQYAKRYGQKKNNLYVSWFDSLDLGSQKLIKEVWEMFQGRRIN